MGVYVTTSAIFTLLPGLDATGTTALVDTHIVRAEGMVNGMLSKKYTVPFTSTAVPPIIRQLVEDYSCYFTMRSLYTRDSQNKSDWTAEFRDLASVTLMEIVNNKVALVDTAGSVLPETIIASSTTRNYAPVFELDTDTSWSIDDDRLDTISSQRTP